MTYLHTATLKLHQYLIDHHWDGHALIGPDPGIRLNYRIGRFIKGYLPNLPWRDSLYYLQGQGYWILANWLMHTQTGDDRYRDIALRCSHTMLRRQQSDGAWEYPNPEWKGRVATAEGTWGALGLLESYRHSGDDVFLQGALNWHRYLIEQIGFQTLGDELSVNYFAGRQGGRVPNNSAFVLRFLAELARLTDEQHYLGPCAGLMTFMQRVQKPSGEFPYSVPGTQGGKDWPHFQCYQYNAFQCLDLMHYAELTGDPHAKPVIQNVLQFLAGGLGPSGQAHYQCGQPWRTVTYHTAALGAAFATAARIGVGDYQALAERAFTYLLNHQHKRGGFVYSRGDYRLLSDRRSYPRYLAMILYHLQSPQAPHETASNSKGTPPTSRELV